MLWLTAAIWGFAFVAQRAGMAYVGPFTYNGIRFALGGLSLVPVLLWQRNAAWKEAAERKRLLKGGLLAGTALFAAASFQQVGMVWTSAGKAGFITGLYVILVPVIGIGLGQMIKRSTWAGAVLAAAGLFLLTVNEQLSMVTGDLLVLISAVFWALHVQLINRLVVGLCPLALSATQFIVCSIASLAVAGFTESIRLQGILDAAVPLLYGGLMSVGVAYTLQVFAQRHIHPAHASIILSCETVFAALGGWIVLHETMSYHGLAGCLLMFLGMWVVHREGP